MAPDGGADRKLFRMLFFEIMIDFFVSSFDSSIIRKKRFYRKKFGKTVLLHSVIVSKRDTANSQCIGRVGSVFS